MTGPVPTCLSHEEVADVAERLEQGVVGFGADPSQMGFEFGEGHLYWIEVGAIGR